MYEKLFERRGLSFERLRTLIEVAEAGGIAKAVGDDPVRQSQYSRQLKELEQFFGTELTTRKGRTLELTLSGKRLAGAARASFLSLCDLRDNLAGAPLEITLGAGEALLQWVLADAIGELQTAHSKIVVTLVNRQTSAIVSAVAEHVLDYGLVRHNAVPASLRSKIVGDLHYRLYVSKTLARKLGTNDPVALFTKAPLATLDGDGDYTHRLEETARKLRSSLHCGLVCTTLPQVCSAVRSGRYAAVLPTIAQSELPPDRFDVYDLPAFKALRRSLALCWHPRLFNIRNESEILTDMIVDIITMRLHSCSIAH